MESVEDISDYVTIVLTTATAERKADKLPTTIDRQPVATVPPGPIEVDNADQSMESRRADPFATGAMAVEAAERSAAAVVDATGATEGIAGVIVDPPRRQDAQQSGNVQQQ